MTATETAIATANETEILLRLSQVLALYPVSRSSWYQGMKAGRFPRPVKLGERMCAWRKSDIDRLVAQTVAR